MPEILRSVAAAGLEVVDMTTEETDLEDLFLQLTRGTREDEPAGGASPGAKAHAGR